MTTTTSTTDRDATADRLDQIAARIRRAAEDLRVADRVLADTTCGTEESRQDGANYIACAAYQALAYHQTAVSNILRELEVSGELRDQLPEDHNLRDELEAS
jgi:hypothetical protein